MPVVYFCHMKYLQRKRIARSLGLLICTVFLLSSVSDDSRIKFKYPKRKNTTITLASNKLKNFKEEWQGTDYYYITPEQDSFICSVLFYKLTEKEMLTNEYLALAAGVPFPSPVCPFGHFTITSNTKELETNEQKWGEVTDDFMFRQADIEEFMGHKLHQKNMYAYAMIDTDIFVQIHLSKIEYSPADSTEMRQILASLRKEN